MPGVESLRSASETEPTQLTCLEADCSVSGQTVSMEDAKRTWRARRQMRQARVSESKRTYSAWLWSRCQGEAQRVAKHALPADCFQTGQGASQRAAEHALRSSPHSSCSRREQPQEAESLVDWVFLGKCDGPAVVGGRAGGGVDVLRRARSLEDAATAKGLIVVWGSVDSLA